jgi:hypothetical protein
MSGPLGLRGNGLEAHDIHDWLSGEETLDILNSGNAFLFYLKNTYLLTKPRAYIKNFLASLGILLSFRLNSA